MVEQQFKSICRLNRLLILAVVLFTADSIWRQAAWWGKGTFAGMLLVGFLFLMANEFLLKIMKRLRDAELQTVSHLGVLLPVVMGVYCGAHYLLSGSFMVYLLTLFCILQAAFLGQPKLGRLLGLGVLVLFLVGLPMGLPKPMALTPVGLSLTVIGFGICLYYYSTMVGRLVRSHTTQVGKLQSMAATDVLTGLTNRRQFNLRLQEELARARRHETPLSLALFDLDDFKRLNDFYGHPVGDRILQELGRRIRQNIRESDLAARYGGEEFALILPETGETEAYDLLERIRLMVAQTVFCLPDNPLTLTISVGVAQLDPKQHTTFELVELADRALYEAKKSGKNQVVKASSLMPKVLLKKKAGQV